VHLVHQLDPSMPGISGPPASGPTPFGRRSAPSCRSPRPHVVPVLLEQLVSESRTISSSSTTMMLTFFSIVIPALRPCWMPRPSGNRCRSPAPRVHVHHGVRKVHQRTPSTGMNEAEGVPQLWRLSLPKPLRSRAVRLQSVMLLPQPARRRRRPSPHLRLPNTYVRMGCTDPCPSPRGA